MARKLDRREFLKFSSLLSLAGFLLHVQLPSAGSQTGGEKNILIVLFDALSFKNLPFYGYPRNTSPNLANMLDKAIVYHNHYASGNYTTPGTASLLTGAYPWTHRALTLGAKVLEKFKDQNLFSPFETYYRIAYTHNAYADVFLRQFFSHLQRYQNPESLFLNKHWLSGLANKDLDIAKLSMLRIFEEDNRSGNSLFIKPLMDSEWMAARENSRHDPALDAYQPLFPHGLPAARELDLSYDAFVIEDAVDWLEAELLDAPQPFLTYFHLLPPHAPYNTRRDFFGAFDNDGVVPLHKPTHLLMEGTDYNNPENYAKNLQLYDEFILYADAEFKRLFDYLESNETISNTVVIFTSDHGEIFERGFRYHNDQTLHQPVIKIPLIIFDPDIPSRVDVYEPTSAVDILPTLTVFTGLPGNPELVGRALSPYAPSGDSRDIFALQAEHNPPLNKIRAGTAMIVRQPYKLTTYFGYPELGDQDPLIEFYNLEDDPEEMENLYRPDDPTAKAMLDTLLDQLNAADQPYK
jgi:arylsulfatase A-like enzyme